jgi:hypothetical protein
MLPWNTRDQHWGLHRNLAGFYRLRSSLTDLLEVAALRLRPSRRLPERQCDCGGSFLQSRPGLLSASAEALETIVPKWDTLTISTVGTADCLRPTPYFAFLLLCELPSKFGICQPLAYNLRERQFESLEFREFAGIEPHGLFVNVGLQVERLDRDISAVDAAF